MVGFVENIIQGKFDGKLVDPGDVRQQPVYLNCSHHGRWKWRESLDGPVVNPDCPKCIEDRRLSSDLGRAAIPPRYQRHSLDTYHVEEQGQRVALECCQDYAANVRRTRDEGRNLLLIGGVGTGKTHLACSVARVFISSGMSALYVRTGEMIDAVRETWGGQSRKSTRRIYRELADYDLLVIDELGRQAWTGDEQNILFKVLEGRNENLRPTILISNFSTEQIKELLGEAAYDRLRANARVVIFDWESWRGRQ